jgi:hypothetical protein
MRVRPVFVIALVAIGAWGGRVAWVRQTSAARVFAYTTCPLFGGPPNVVMKNDIPFYDTLVTRVHEEVHAAQCREMGPIKYRLNSLTDAGKMKVETPAYCAAAIARLLVDADSEYVSDRVHTDMIEGMREYADSETVKSALMKECPAIASKPRRTRGPPRKPKA